MDNQVTEITEPSADHLRPVLSLIQVLIENGKGANEAELKSLWNYLSTAINHNELVLKQEVDLAVAKRDYEWNTAKSCVEELFYNKANQEWINGLREVTHVIIPR